MCSPALFVIIYVTSLWRYCSGLLLLHLPLHGALLSIWDWLSTKCGRPTTCSATKFDSEWQESKVFKMRWDLQKAAGICPKPYVFNTLYVWNFANMCVCGMKIGMGSYGCRCFSRKILRLSLEQISTPLQFGLGKGA